jgi:hypothetical protein
MRRQLFSLCLVSGTRFFRRYCILKYPGVLGLFVVSFLRKFQMRNVRCLVLRSHIFLRTMCLLIVAFVSQSWPVELLEDELVAKTVYQRRDAETAYSLLERLRGYSVASMAWCDIWEREQVHWTLIVLLYSLVHTLAYDILDPRQILTRPVWGTSAL